MNRSMQAKFERSRRQTREFAHMEGTKALFLLAPKSDDADLIAAAVAAGKVHKCPAFATSKERKNYAGVHMERRARDAGLRPNSSREGTSFGSPERLLGMAVRWAQA